MKKTVEDIFLEYPTFSKQIKQLNEELTDAVNMRVFATSLLKGTQITGLPRRTETGDPTAEAATEVYKNIEEMCNEWKEYVEYRKWRINQIIEQKIDVEEWLFMLEPQERRIIELRYFIYPPPKYGWNKVISEMKGYCDREVYRIHKKAIEKINLSVNVSKKAI